jgi:hypothetical protein
MAVNVTDIVKDFKEVDAQAYLEAYPFADLKYRSVFPEKYQSGLTWKQIEAQTGAKVAADVVAFNSRAPRKGRPLPGKASGDMPKIEIARDKTESDFNTYRALMNDLGQVNNAGARSNILGQIMDWRYDDQVFAVDGVTSRLEWISKQIASNGKYSLTLTNNEAGVQTKLDVDFGIATANRVNAVKDWSDASADIVADIEARRDAARTKGKILRYMYTDQSTVNQASKNAGFQKFTATYAAVALGMQQRPDLESMNAALSRQGLPIFVLWDSFVAIEGKDGNQVTESGWVAGNVTFSESLQLGDTQYTLTADEYVSVGQATKTKSGIVLVKTWGIEDPITVITKGVAYATPVLNAAPNIHILKTKLS